MSYYYVHCADCGARTTAEKMAVNIDAMIEKYCELRGTHGDNEWMKRLQEIYKGVHPGMFFQRNQLKTLGSENSDVSLVLTCEDVIRYLEMRYHRGILDESMEDEEDEEDDDMHLLEEYYEGVERTKDSEGSSNIDPETISVLSDNLNMDTTDTEQRKSSVKKLLGILMEHRNDTILSCSLEWIVNKDDQGNDVNSKCKVTYFGIGGTTNVVSYEMVCPQCGKKMGTKAGLYKEYVIIMLGSARVGKTAYLAAMVDMLSKNKLKEISVDYDTSEGMKQFKNGILAQYRKGVKIEKTDEMNMNTISLFTLCITLGKKPNTQSILLKFVDMPGEAWDGTDEFILNKRKICKYASAFWMCVDPVQISLYLKNAAKPSEENNEKNEDEVNQDLENVVGQIKEKLGTLMTAKELEAIPLAIILTKSDMADWGDTKENGKRLFRPELSQEEVEGKTKLNTDLMNGNSIRKERFQRFQELAKEYIDQTNLSQVMDQFDKKSCFAVAAVGRKLEEENPDHIPCQPSLVELPLLWLLANFGYIGVVEKQQVDIPDKQGVMGGLRGFFGKSKKSEAPELMDVACDVNKLYI